MDRVGFVFQTMLFPKDEGNSSVPGESFDYTTSSNGNRIRFWVLFSLQLCSIVCFLFLFRRFVFKRRIEQTIHHHVVVVLIVTSFIFVTSVLSISLAYMYRSYVIPSTHLFCSIWTWFHYSVNIINLFLMGFASIERHWLIFHPSLIQTQSRRIVFHYCPIVFCLVYPPTFYALALFVHQCENDYNFTQLLCTWPCYFYNPNWARVDLFFNNYTPLVTIPLACTSLYIRVFIQKHKLKQQPFKWSRDKKLILQIWAISTLYLAMWMPIQLTGLINTYWDPSFMLQEQIDYMYLFPYLIHIFYPFIVLLSFYREIIKSTQNVATVSPIQR